MALIPKQPVAAATFNSAFVSKTDDDAKTGKLRLENDSGVSGAAVDDTQKAINDNAAAIAALPDASYVDTQDAATLASANSYTDSAIDQELAATITNNQTTFADIAGMILPAGKSGMLVDYQIQRITTSTGATELIETGCISVSKLSSSCRLTNISSDEDAGLELDVTSSGQVQYKSSDITGVPSVSKITFKLRTLSA
jgi:hypothetical protein